MDDIVDMLRERHDGGLIALELPDEDRLVEIEEQLLIPLPADYKAFLLSASDIVCGSLEPATVMDDYAHNFLPEMAANSWNQGLPRYLIPVCETPNGIYAMSQEGEVVLWQPEQGINEDEVWGSIWQWAREVWLES
ncbi:hypothetical protein AS19_17910 [Alcanivorax sp. NBRC 101098]|uniref:SMI1/KNR4 family protein n=1 Tax=Alcanivorax sp. NBRC 101098 TaxID=1113728 RepID=UPI0004ABD585|nr:SMI1/KNR4 family protein [Alcanivorax sp. NBRC 101098]BAP14642.1 hypothetical protein AS19_17910 [Alcanivorax sp. NBRC 101098]